MRSNGFRRRLKCCSLSILWIIGCKILCSVPISLDRRPHFLASPCLANDCRDLSKQFVFNTMKATTKLCCHFLTDAVTYISTQSTPGGIEAAINPILVALGLRLPFDSTPPVPIPNEALEELVLQLSDFSMTEQAGKRRASARASLIYHPAEPHQPQVHSALPIRILLIHVFLCAVFCVFFCRPRHTQKPSATSLARCAPCARVSGLALCRWLVVLR